MTSPHTPTTQRVDYLCQCGWGLLSMPVDLVPNFCPECDFELHTTPEEEE